LRRGRRIEERSRKIESWRIEQKLKVVQEPKSGEFRALSWRQEVEEALAESQRKGRGCKYEVQEVKSKKWSNEVKLEESWSQKGGRKSRLKVEVGEEARTRKQKASRFKSEIEEDGENLKL
jgi:hypothetical protein